MRAICHIRQWINWRFTRRLLHFFAGILLASIALGALKTLPPDAARASTVEGTVEQVSLVQAGQDSERCGTIDTAPAGVKRLPSQDELPIYQMQAAAFAAGSAAPRTVRVAFHVIESSTGEGDVTDAQINRQMEVMNRAYHDAGFRFVLASVDRTVNDKWVDLKPGTSEERKIEQTLAIDPAHTLNIYIADMVNPLLGWSHFPWDFEETSWENAVFVRDVTLPGGPSLRYSEGATATHEVGHYMGLFHTFQGGCTEPNDYAADTPEEAIPAFGCPVGRDTCLASGLDPIQNFMDYSDDACMTEFTSDQAVRMIWAVDTYRPSLAQ